MSGCSGCSFKGMSTAVEDTFVGVRFREETNLTLCGTGGRIYARGEKVVVDLEAGPTFGHVEQSPMPVFKPCQKSSARPILRAGRRRATSPPTTASSRTSRAASSSPRSGRARSSLDMKISLVDFALSGKKATFYFTSEGGWTSGNWCATCRAGSRCG